MPGNRILDRFRPVGSPGPGIAGVPDDSERTADELAPVFAALEQDIARHDAALDAASRRAQDIVDAARRRADATVAEARSSAAAIQSEEASRVLTAAAGADERTMTDARLRAQALLDAAGPRIGPAVDRLITSILDPDHTGRESGERR